MSKYDDDKKERIEETGETGKFFIRSEGAGASPSASSGASPSASPSASSGASPSASRGVSSGAAPGASSGKAPKADAERGMIIDGGSADNTGGTYEKLNAGYEKIDGASRTDRVNVPDREYGSKGKEHLAAGPEGTANRLERRRKREFRATMVTVVCLLVAIGAVVIAMDGYSPWRDGNNQTNLSREEGESIAAADEREQDVVQPMPTVDSRDNADTGAGSAEDGQTPQSGGTPAYVPPVAGTLMNDYSMDVPIYSKTLDQYVIHTGVDIEAKKDSQVKAVAGGTVTAVYEDDRLGNTVDIAHGDGLVSRYANLSKGILVEVGDVVEQGQVIAGVGDTALFESTDPPHLHFELLKDELPVDPNTYIKF